jgi:hypothetical protein
VHDLLQRLEETVVGIRRGEAGTSTAGDPRPTRRGLCCRLRPIAAGPTGTSGAGKTRCERSVGYPHNLQGLSEWVLHIRSFLGSFALNNGPHRSTAIGQGTTGGTKRRGGSIER